jgi:hypothetical protein
VTFYLKCPTADERTDGERALVVVAKNTPLFGQPGAGGRLNEPNYPEAMRPVNWRVASDLKLTPHVIDVLEDAQRAFSGPTAHAAVKQHGKLLKKCYHALGTFGLQVGGVNCSISVPDIWTELGARMAEYVPLHHVVNGESLSYSSSIQNYFNAVKRGGTAGKVCSSPSPS